MLIIEIKKALDLIADEITCPCCVETKKNKIIDFCIEQNNKIEELEKQIADLQEGIT